MKTKKYPNKQYKILLFGQGSYLNKGCEALVTVITKNIKGINPDNKVTVATFDIENDKKYHKDLVDEYIAHKWKRDLTETEKSKSVGHSNIDLILQKEILDDIPKEDICVSIGGDNYCYEDNLNFLSTINDKAREENKKLILFGASINENVITKEFIKDIRKFDLILVRESLTYNVLSKYVDKEKLLLRPDPAFSLEPQKVKLQKDFSYKEDIVGLNMSPLILGYQGENVDIISNIKKLINHILSSTQYRIALIPHVYLEGGNDLEILRQIKREYPAEDRVFVVDERIYNCGELKYIISKCKFLIAARTHASIAAYSTRVPALVLGYSIKSRGIAQDIFGDYRDYVLPVQDIEDGNKLIEKFEFLRDNEAKIKKTLSEKMPIYKEKANNLFGIVMEKVEDLEEKNVTKKENCSGCTACKNSCTKSAIEMCADEEGFSYPVINKVKCIDCGICRKVCPNNKSYSYKYKNIHAYACKNMSEDERLQSSSGGVFSLLAKNILKDGGYVFGAAYVGHDIKHIKVDNEKDLKKIMGSKYAESSIGECYAEAKKGLDAGKKVLFSGVPCQIEGLKSFLGKDYPNLFCVSIFCHGVPSKKVFAERLEAMEKHHGDKLVGINFRNKDNGWKNSQIEYAFKTKKIVRGMWEDEYMTGFLKDYFLRQSCYACDFRLFKKNTSDIVLGDFWGIDIEDENFNDDKGVSAVILNSEKGTTLFNSIKKRLVIKKFDVEQIGKHNPALLEPAKTNFNRFEFFNIFNKMGTSFAMDYFSKEENIKQLKNDLEQNRTKIGEIEGQLKQSKKNEEEKVLEILNSRRWRVSDKLISIFNIFFPYGSFRRKVLRAVYRGFSKIAENIIQIYGDITNNPKLIMTLLVRDEADIIRQNIEFHLSKGVDFIIATDNGSIDGTRDILAEYERKGVLYLIDEKDQDHSQSKWVNRMGKIAYEEHGADIIFHCDADEFWWPRKGNLKTELKNSLEDVMTASIIHVLLEDKNGKETFPIDVKYALVKPIEPENYEMDSKDKNFYFFKNPPKVIFKTMNGFLEVDEGNHTIKDVKYEEIELSKNILIYHFPLRGKKHFFEKIKRAGEAITANKNLSEGTGWHWRRWYKSYLDGELDDEYNKLMISNDEARKMEKSGMIEEFDFKKFMKGRNGKK